MSTSKKTTAKKAVKKTTTAKKAVKKTTTAKKAVKKTTTTKKAVDEKSHRIPIIGGASLYFETLAKNINEAAVVGYEKIEYYDSMFGIRAEVKGKKIIIETGFSDLFANLVENGRYEICEYQINNKKVNKKKFK